MFVCVVNLNHYFKWRVRQCCYCGSEVRFIKDFKL